VFASLILLSLFHSLFFPSRRGRRSQALALYMGLKAYARLSFAQVPCAFHDRQTGDLSFLDSPLPGDFFRRRREILSARFGTSCVFPATAPQGLFKPFLKCGFLSSIHEATTSRSRFRTQWPRDAHCPSPPASPILLSSAGEGKRI